MSTRPRETDEPEESREERKSGVRRIEAVESAGRMEVERREKAEREEFRRVGEAVIQRLRSGEHKPMEREAMREATVALFRAAEEESRRPRTVAEPVEKHVQPEPAEAGEERATREAVAILHERRETAEEEQKRRAEARAAFVDTISARRVTREEGSEGAAEARVAAGSVVREEREAGRETEKAEPKKEETFKAPFGKG